MIAAHLSNSTLDDTMRWPLRYCIAVIDRMDAVGSLVNPYYSAGEKPLEATPATLAAVGAMLGGGR